MPAVQTECGMSERPDNYERHPSRRDWERSRWYYDESDVWETMPGKCQVCGRITSDAVCYATDRCKEAGGADVM
jgi:hypothetical protein